MTIPRLELVATHALSKLLPYIAKLLNIEISHTYAWTDTGIVLCWLQKSPSSLKTFVAHHTDCIQRSIPATQWKHVSSGDNPADLLSRRILPSKLITSALWWHGPSWLSKPPSEWQKPQFVPPRTIPE